MTSTMILASAAPQPGIVETSQLESARHAANVTIRIKNILYMWSK